MLLCLYYTYTSYWYKMWNLNLDTLQTIEPTKIFHTAVGIGATISIANFILISCGLDEFKGK